MPDFQACAAAFVGNQTAIDLYGWKGAVHNLPKNESSQISLAGCHALCGKGAQYYSWDMASATILNWVSNLACFAHHRFSYTPPAESLTQN